MKKNFSILVLSTFLSLSAVSMPLMASPQPTPSTTPHCHKKIGMHGPSTPIPFKRLMNVVTTLKTQGSITDKDIEAINNYLSTIKPEALERSQDKYSTVTDLLLKNKIITQDQHKLIIEGLKK